MADIDINEKFVLYYAVRGFRSGQTVTVSIYDSAGTVEINAQSMTERASQGVHSFNFFPKKRTDYFAVMDCTQFPQKTHQVIRVRKQKLAGAINIPRVKVPPPVLKEEDKKKIFAALEIAKKPKLLTDPELLQSVDDLKKSHSELALSVARALNYKGKSLEDFSKDTLSRIEKERVSASLSAKKQHEDFSRDVSLSIDNLHKEIAQLKVVQEKFLDLKMVVSELVRQSDTLAKQYDDVARSLKLAHDSTAPDFKDKVEDLSQNLDELNIILKNANIHNTQTD